MTGRSLGQRRRVAAAYAAENASEFAGQWLDGSDLVLGFTQNGSKHEMALGSGFKVVELTRSLSELERVRDEVQRAQKEIGFEIAEIGVVMRDNVVEIYAESSDPQGAKSEVERRWGDAVRFESGELFAT